MVEVVGIWFVVSVLMVGVIGRVVDSGAGPVPSTVWWSICRAFSAAPGMESLQCEAPEKAGESDSTDPKSDQDQDRAHELGVPCTQSQTSRTDKIHGTAFSVRVGTSGSDEIRVNGDGTATVVLGQGVEGGVEAGVDTGNLNASAHAVATGEVRHVYNFPDEASARAFLDSRRNGLNRVVDVVPGAQTVKEGGTRVGNWLQENVGDRMPWVSDADKEKHRQDRANNTSDGISFAVGGKVNASAGAELSDRVKAGVEAEIGVKGEATTYFEKGKGSTFTASIEGKVSGNVTAKLGDGPVSGLLSGGVGGQVGGKASYQVVFDGNGQPTRLVLTAERTAQVQGEGSVKVGDNAKVGPKGSLGGTVVDTWTLDLTDPANRAAFDGTFDIATVSSGDHSAGVAFPKIVPTPSQIDAWQELNQRINDDSFQATYNYTVTDGSVTGSDKDHSAKGGSFGGGVSTTSTSRTLNSATGRDNRTGGAEAPLSTCED